jgi:hypothetical protein
MDYYLNLKLGEFKSGKHFAILEIGLIPLASLVYDKDRGKIKVYLEVSGLTALGLAEEIRPGVTGEILQKVRGVVRERVRRLVIAELVRGVLRELSTQESLGE